MLLREVSKMQNINLTAEEREALKSVKKNEDIGLPSNEQYEARGIGTGQDKESMKQRLMAMLEEVGYMETLTTPAEQQQFVQELDSLVDLLIKEDLQAVQNHPLMKKIEQIMPNQSPQQQAPQQAGPKDFASMMPPGGGMSGR